MTPSPRSSPLARHSGDQWTSPSEPSLRYAPLAVWWMGVAALVLMAMGCLAAMPGVDGVRLLIRATARSSLLFFLLAYTAQAAVQTWPGPGATWQRAHRRQWGWLFAASHTVHAAAIVALAIMAPDLFNTLAPLGNRISGGVAYAFIWAMALTSFDRSARWLGPVCWARLHTWGLHYIWLSFLVANGKRVALHPAYAVPTLLLLAALCWRLWASRSGVKRAVSPARASVAPASPTASHPGGSARH